MKKSTLIARGLLVFKQVSKAAEYIDLQVWNTIERKFKTMTVECPKTVATEYAGLYW